MKRELHFLTRILQITHHPFLLFLLLLLPQAANAQVVIKERVELNPTTSSIKSNQLNSTQSTITQQLDVEFSFVPFSYDVDGGRVYGRVYMEKTCISQPFILRENGHVEDGFATISYTFSEPPNSIICIGVGSSFGTTLGHDPIQFNSGNANVQVKIYLDGILRPESYTSSTYNQGYMLLVISTPPDCPNANNQYCTGLGSIPQIVAEEIRYDARYTKKNCQNIPPTWISYWTNQIYNIEDNIVIQDACFNKQTQTWQFSYSGLNTIKYKQIIDFCPQNLDNIRRGAIFVDDIAEIPIDYICNYLRDDLERMKVYGSYPSLYVLKPIVYFHEREHLKEFENTLQKFSNNWFYDYFEKINFSCNFFLSPDDAKMKAKEKVFTALIKHLQFVIKNNPQPEPNEQSYQDNIKPFINAYIKHIDSLCQ